jgi:23S rRNA (guanine2445-N2)-methyltransferase / 23S rRNA (guanine2069-N7)-methyltransferase
MPPCTPERGSEWYYPPAVELVVQCPRDVEDLLAEELVAIGAREVRVTGGACLLDGSQELAYRVWYWSRLGSRLLLPVATGSVQNREDLYALASSVPWPEHMAVDDTFSVRANVTRGGAFDPRFAGLVVKDAVADQFRQRVGRRPSVDREDPSLQISVLIRDEAATLSLDPGGGPLHRRGYRQFLEGTGGASLKENLAAALLLRAKWPAAAAAGGALVDPMCGSGTILIEAAAMAGDIAPGLLRGMAAPTQALSRWREVASDDWRRVSAEAEERRAAGARGIPPIIGGDVDADAVRLARRSIASAGLDKAVLVSQRDVRKADDLHKLRAAVQAAAVGLVATNPPYGVRLAATSTSAPRRSAAAPGHARRDTGQRGAAHAEPPPPDLIHLYRALGRGLQEAFAGWRAVVLTTSEDLGRATGLRAERVHRLTNGALECRLLHFQLEQQVAGAGDAWRVGAEELRNRLGKNLHRFGRWARRHGINSYRVYDADLPNYNAAVDWFDGRWAHIQEYAAPAEIEPRSAAARLGELVDAVQQVLDVAPEALFVKQRAPQRGSRQYQKLGDQRAMQWIREGELEFRVNFTDYLDVGLFLDMRGLRQHIQALAQGTRFLNLFAYTAAATVAAAAGGARTTTSVDSSMTYLRWAAANLEHNGFDDGARHALLQEECLAWLAENAATDQRFDLILVDPPTFSNAKGRLTSFEVQRDHATLIEATLPSLAPAGTILFASNRGGFRLDEAALAALGLSWRNLAPELGQLDYERRKNRFHIWALERT